MEKNRKHLSFRYTNPRVKLLSRVQLIATVAYQPPPSMGFSRQEHWSRLPFPYSGFKVHLAQRGHEGLRASTSVSFVAVIQRFNREVTGAQWPYGTWVCKFLRFPSWNTILLYPKSHTSIPSSTSYKLWPWASDVSSLGPFPHLQQGADSLLPVVGRQMRRVAAQ